MRVIGFGAISIERQQKNTVLLHYVRDDLAEDPCFSSESHREGVAIYLKCIVAYAYQAAVGGFFVSAEFEIVAVHIAIGENADILVALY